MLFPCSQSNHPRNGGSSRVSSEKGTIPSRKRRFHFLSNPIKGFRVSNKREIELRLRATLSSRLPRPIKPVSLPLINFSFKLLFNFDPRISITTLTTDIQGWVSRGARIDSFFKKKKREKIFSPPLLFFKKKNFRYVESFSRNNIFLHANRFFNFSLITNAMDDNKDSFSSPPFPLIFPPREDYTNFPPRIKLKSNFQFYLEQSAGKEG